MAKILPAAKARAEALLSQIARRKQAIAEDFYDIGAALRELQEKKLFAALGYATFGDMLKARNVLGLSQAHKLIRLVSAMSRDDALAVGQEKAIALVDYTRATRELDSPATVLAAGRLAKGKRAADASVRELRDATKAARKKSAPRAKTSPEEKEAARDARSIQAWMRGRGAKGATAEVARSKAGLVIRIELPAKTAAAILG